MKRQLPLFITLAAISAICFGMQPSRSEVETSGKNVVANRLEGDWQLHVPLTQRLLARQLPPAIRSSRAHISFEGDDSVTQNIPAKYKDFLKDRTIYKAGIMTVQDNDYPFILIEFSGNPHLVYFRERNGDPMGDEESFIVMLAAATHDANDLLFIGGDHSDEPFAAYERRRQKSDEIPLQAKPIIDWLNAMKNSDLELFKSVYSQRMQARIEDRGWEETFAKVQEACKTEFGDFILTDFEFLFEGDDRAGKLKTTYKDESLPPLDIIKQNNEWKINEY
jgi:broad-specificity NMP kinase